MDYRYTRLWRINHTLVIADSIEEAIELYKTKFNDPIYNDITSIKAIGNNQIPEDFDVLIKK